VPLHLSGHRLLLRRIAAAQELRLKLPEDGVLWTIWNCGQAVCITTNLREKRASFKPPGDAYARTGSTSRYRRG
jgi:hypothetical protein